MDIIEETAWENLQNWPGEGVPAKRLEDILQRLGLSLQETCLPPGVWGKLDLGTRTIHVERHMAQKCDHPGANVPAIRRFTIGHEIGHYVLHKPRLFKGLMGRREEREADYYAGCLLAPTRMLNLEQEVEEMRYYRARRVWLHEKRVKDLIDRLSGRYLISMSAVKTRLGQMGLLEKRRLEPVKVVSTTGAVGLLRSQLSGL